MRNLILILGDQLDRESAALAEIDREQDLIVMFEVREESTHVWSHKTRTALFLAAMRHFREDMIKQGHRIEYRELTSRGNTGSLAGELTRAITRHRPQRVVMVEPGDYRVREDIERVCESLNVPLETRSDSHFYSTIQDFADHARGRKQLRLEYFYRDLRKRFDVLMEDGQPVGGDWNYDSDNRGSFGKSGLGVIPPPVAFPPDPITADVLKLVAVEFADHPGRLDHFDWPVTPKQAMTALDDFITYRLPAFGQYQDAMWTDEPYLFHSRLSAALNLKLINPRVVVDRAEAAYRRGQAPLPAVEGFIRQVLGWREYVRGIYWQFMPQYAERNALQAHAPLPKFYWTGETDCHCLRQSIRQTLDYGYAHHIQRLMVTGLFALLLGVEPKAIHEWYLAVYVDAVEWVELPNVIGMSQFADGGIMASKPYIASGKYIDRMSNYCKGCRYDPGKNTGPTACPITVLYWDFIRQHEALLAANPRTIMQVKNWSRMDESTRAEIAAAAERFRKSLL
jgi:deoxyribodipyrimidine photolyase-related protein